MDEMNEELNQSLNCGINGLNEDVLTHIFNYFTIKERINLRTVCNKWQTIINNNFKFEKVLNRLTVLGQNRKHISKHELSLIIKKCFNVKHIDLYELIDTEVDQKVDNFGDNLLQTISKCIHLENIFFWDFKIREDLFLSLSQYFSQLKRLFSQNITQRALNSIIDSQNLESIDLTNNRIISRPDFRRLGPKVKELHLRGSQLFTEIVFQDICNGNGIHLTHLSIDLRNIEVLKFISQMKELELLIICLNVSNCDFTLLSKLKCLTSFKIYVMNELNSNQFRDIVTSLKDNNLLEFYITFAHYFDYALNNESLYELSENLKTLNTLVIRGAKHINSDALLSIANMKALKYLDLMDCKCIGDEIDVVINSCPLLTHLVLHNCSLITVLTVGLFIEKAEQNQNQHYFLDVINTSVSQLFDSEIPSNLKLLFNNKYCVYNCNHSKKIAFCSVPYNYSDKYSYSSNNNYVTLRDDDQEFV